MLTLFWSFLIWSLCETLMLYSDQLNFAMLINSKSLHPWYHAYSSIHSLQQIIIVGSQPPYKDFEDLGLALNPWSFFLAQIFILFLLVACFLHFTNWLHVDYIGNEKYLILSLRFILSWLKNGLHLSFWRHKLICWFCVTWHLLIADFKCLFCSLYSNPSSSDLYVKPLCSILTNWILQWW